MNYKEPSFNRPSSTNGEKKKRKKKKKITIRTSHISHPCDTEMIQSSEGQIRVFRKQKRSTIIHSFPPSTVWRSASRLPGCTVDGNQY